MSNITFTSLLSEVGKIKRVNFNFNRFEAETVADGDKKYIVLRLAGNKECEKAVYEEKDIAMALLDLMD